MTGWAQLWTDCHGPGGVRLAWPDGGSLMEQPAIVVRVFSLIAPVARSVADALAKQEAESRR